MSTIPQEFQQNIHPLFQTAAFIENDYVNQIVSNLMDRVDLEAEESIPLGEIPLQGRLYGRIVNSNYCWIARLFHELFLCIRKIWHNFCLCFSANYNAKFYMAAGLISAKDRENEEIEQTGLQTARLSEHFPNEFAAAQCALKNFDFNSPKRIADKMVVDAIDNKVREQIGRELNALPSIVQERANQLRDFFMADVQKRIHVEGALRSSQQNIADQVRAELENLKKIQENQSSLLKQQKELIAVYENAVEELRSIKYTSLLGKNIPKPKTMLTDRDKTALQEIKERMSRARDDIKRVIGEHSIVNKGLNMNFIGEHFAKLNKNIELRKSTIDDLSFQLQGIEANVLSHTKVLNQLNPPNASPTLPLDDYGENLVGASSSRRIAIQAETSQKTPQVQMLNDIAEKTHPEIARMWEIVLNKFPHTEIIQEWHLSSDGTFKMVLTQPITMWVYDKEYERNGGVLMLFGSQTGGIITGTLVNGNLPLAHEQQAESVFKQFSNDAAKVKGQPAGMIFSKDSNGISGVQTFCYWGRALVQVWPRANCEHILRLREAEQGRMNIVISATYGFSTEGRLRSSVLFEEAWNRQGVIETPSDTRYPTLQGLIKKRWK